VAEITNIDPVSHVGTTIREWGKYRGQIRLDIPEVGSGA
jgi:hypothetical protein